MKKHLSILCAAMLCACCLALAACGGGAASSASSASAGFTGTWKLAGAENQGITMAGDFTAMLGIDEMSITLADDGTGTITGGTNTRDITWEQTGDNSVSIKAATSEDSSASSASADSSDSLFDATFQDGVMAIVQEQNGNDISMFLTADGSLPGAPVIDISAAQPITAEADLIGTWKLSSIGVNGLTMYGDSDALSSMAGNADTTVEFKAGGEATALGSAVKYTVDADGAKLDIDGLSIPVVNVNGSVGLDLTDVFGYSMVLVFSK